MTILEHMALDAQIAQKRQRLLWERNLHPASIFVPDRHSPPPAAARGLDEYNITHEFFARAVDLGAY